MVRDAEKYFIFFADIFGSVLLPLREEEYHEEAAAGREAPDPSFKLSPDGTLECGKFSYALPRFSDFTSFAFHDRTFCVTTPLSHSLFFGGLTREE